MGRLFDSRNVQTVAPFLRLPRAASQGTVLLDRLHTVCHAWYLYQHVIDGYEYLMQNYNVGDRVCLFGVVLMGGSLLTVVLLGFSRGAYTARALVGMLYKV